MHLTPSQAMHVAPRLWQTLTDEERKAACSISLSTLNDATLDDADDFAARGNPVAAAYIVRKHESPKIMQDNAAMVYIRTHGWKLRY